MSRVTCLIVVDNVEPRNNVGKQLRIPRVSGSNALEIRRELGCAIERLSLLNFIDHFSHIHFHLARVLSEAVEAICACISC